MNTKTFSKSFSKTFSKSVTTAMHLKWTSYLLLLGKPHIFNPKSEHGSFNPGHWLQLFSGRIRYPPVSSTLFSVCRVRLYRVNVGGKKRRQ